MVIYKQIILLWTRVIEEGLVLIHHGKNQSICWMAQSFRPQAMQLQNKK